MRDKARPKTQLDKPIISWQGWQVVNRTSEENQEVNVEEIRTAVGPDGCKNNSATDTNSLRKAWVAEQPTGPSDI